MKRIVKIFIILFIGLQIVNVKAATIYKGKLYELWHPDSGFTVFAAESNGYMDYNSWIIKSTIDDRVYYCIDPALPLEGSEEGSHTYIYKLSEMVKETNITESTYKKINLLAYYGYGYKDENVNHTNKKWYGITQVMIWRVVRPDLTWTFKETRNSTPDKNLYKNEIEEINNLIKKHNALPSFLPENKRLEIIIGQETTFKDESKILSKYLPGEIQKDFTYKLENNQLTVTGYKKTQVAIYLEMNPRTKEKYALFTSDKYQDIIVLGEPIDNRINIMVNVTGGVINLQKIDNKTNENTPQGEASLEGAIYNVYDEKNNIVGEIITDENGKGQISLKDGIYKIKESKAPTGYNLSTEEYQVVIDSKTDHVDIIDKEEVITGNLKIVKTKGGSGEKYIPEENAQFEIINSKNEVISNVKTNEKGVIEEKLPYGTYKIHQTSGEKGYILQEDKIITINENKNYELELKDIKLSKLEFLKLDSLTNKPIPNTEIEVYKIEEKNDKLIYKGVTNKKGKITVPNLVNGTYYAKETKASKDYILNEKEIYFEVTKPGNIIKIIMKNNKKEELSIPNTLKNKSYFIVIISIILTTSGVAYIIYEKKKN